MIIIINELVIYLWWVKFLKMNKYTVTHKKNSHKCQFFESEIYISPDSWINKLCIDVCLWFR